MAIESYPLTWPQGWKRTTESARRYAQFGVKKQNPAYSFSSKQKLTVSEGVIRTLESLQKMGVDKQDVIISTNIRVRLDGMPRSGEKEPSDPGVAVYWRTTPTAPMRCMAIDQYLTVAGNLGAIAATLEAMRAIERHGGAEVMERQFTGFKALEAENAGESWWTTLGVEASASADEIEAGYKRQLRIVHPDVEGGSHEAMQKLNLARDQARAVRR